MVLITGSGWGGLESVSFRFRFTHSRRRRSDRLSHEFADTNLVDVLVLLLPHILCYSTEDSIVIVTYRQSMLFFPCKCIFWGSLNPNIYVVGFRKCTYICSQLYLHMANSIVLTTESRVKTFTP